MYSFPDIHGNPCTVPDEPCNLAFNADCMELLKATPDKKKPVRHGLSRTRIYRIYVGMIGRCYRKTSTIYKKYGGKGVAVCDEWRGENGFLNFYRWSIEHGYTDSLTIDRIDPRKGYSPDNCRWATYTEQNSHLDQPPGISGVRGVSWSNKENKWISILSVNGKSVRVGCFNTISDAARARNKYIEEHNILRQKTEIDEEYFKEQEEKFRGTTAQMSLFVD